MRNLNLKSLDDDALEQVIGGVSTDPGELPNIFSPEPILFIDGSDPSQSVPDIPLNKVIPEDKLDINKDFLGIL